MTIALVCVDPCLKRGHCTCVCIFSSRGTPSACTPSDVHDQKFEFDFPWELQLFRCNTIISDVMHDEFFILIFPGSFSYSDVPSYSDESRVVRVLYVKAASKKKI